LRLMLGEVPLARVIARARGVRLARAVAVVEAVAVEEVARAVEAFRKGASIIRKKTGTEGPGGTLAGVMAHTVVRAVMDAAAEVGAAVRTGNTVQMAMAGETGGPGA
jgi:hypothetical protein